MLKNHIKDHFVNRFNERVTPDMYDEVLGQKIKEKCNQLIQQSEMGIDESVCIHVWNQDDIEDGENELWVMIRDRNLVTCWRRDETHRTSTSCFGMKVDRMSYQLVN